jgi:hypothetical protein
MARLYDGVNRVSLSTEQPFSSFWLLEAGRGAWHLPPMTDSKRTGEDGDDHKAPGRKAQGPEAESREDRLARALRENLRRRKAKKD